MTQNPYENYLEAQVLSATPVELVAILYRAAIDSLRTARLYLAAGDVRARSDATNRATNMVVELVQSLDRNQGGELVRNLNELYDYILRRMHQATARPDDAAYAEAIQLLSTLLEAWQAIIEPPRTFDDGGLSRQEREPIECSF